MKERPDTDSLDGEALEYELQKTRIRKIIDSTIYKLKILSQLQTLLADDGAVLRKFLSKTEADFVILVCQESPPFTKQVLESRSDIELICNMIERINLYEKKGGSTTGKKSKSYSPADHLDMYVAYAMDIIFKCAPLLEYVESVDETPDSLMMEFVEAMNQLNNIINERLSISAEEEVKRENDLKTAFRLSMLLSSNIQEMEELLERQREELGKEHDRKEMILQELTDKIDALKETCSNEINRIVYDSEVNMMKDYNKSVEVQAELSEEAAKSTRDYENLLEKHLEEEKTLRVKRLKVEAQLASWVTKYDTDMGEKQAEYDELERAFNQEKEDFDLLQDMFDEQEKEYTVLMKEKEEEEERINYEKAWVFLQNRAARIIQRAWKHYKARKLARRKKKGKKKGGSAGSKKGKGKSGAKKSPGGKKGKKEKKQKKVKVPKDEAVHLSMQGPDPNAILRSAFRESILGEIKSKEAFPTAEMLVGDEDATRKSSASPKSRSESRRSTTKERTSTKVEQEQETLETKDTQESGGMVEAIRKSRVSRKSSNVERRSKSERKSTNVVEESADMTPKPAEGN